MSPKHLYGIHDPGGEHLMADAPGTIVYTVNAADDAPLDFGALAARGFRALVRLNHSHHGHGTIPPDPALWGHFAQSCAAFVGDCRGVFDFTIGNEPNLRVEWGRDNPILPEQYAACYRQVYDTIKGLYPHVNVSPAAIGPWNVESGVEWVEYFRRMLDSISAPYIDFICLHTYSRGYSPSSVTDNSRMDAPHQNRHNGFRAYKDFLDAVPPALRGVPVDIKETNGNESWPNQNTGWVQAAYAEIHRHNQTPGVQKIRSLCLFRWPKFDERWQFETKTGVHDDFRAAVARRYAAPAPAPVQPPPTPPQPPKPPAPPTPPPQPVQPLPVRLIDESFSQRVPQVDLSDGTPGKTHYRLVRAEYVADAARRFGPDHHILVDVLDRDGNRKLGAPVEFWWADGQEVRNTDKPSDPYAVDYAMHAAGHSYGVRVGVPDASSDQAFGMGLGKLGNEHMGDHVSYFLTFRETLPDAPVVPRPQPDKPGLIKYVSAPAGLNVRAAPRMDAKVTDTLPHGTPVRVEGVHGVWRKVGLDAWVHGAYLSDTQPAPPVVDPRPVEPVPSGDCWARAYPFVIRWEGLWADHPSDPGGATMKGITIGTYTRWREAQGQPKPSKNDLRNISDAEVEAIYREWYWRASGADKLPWPLCLAVFDTAVNGGVGRATDILARSNGDFLRYMGILIDWYTRLDTFPTFGRAWIRRRAEILLEAAK